MATIDQATSYTIEVSYDMIRHALCVRSKTKNETVLWEPVMKQIVECQFRLASMHQDIVKYDKKILLKLHKDLVSLLTEFEPQLSRVPTVVYHELNYRIQVERLFDQIRKLANDSLYLATAEEPDENSEAYHTALSAMVEETLTSTERLKGKKRLMALFD